MSSRTFRNEEIYVCQQPQVSTSSPKRKGRFHRAEIPDFAMARALHRATAKLSQSLTGSRSRQGCKRGHKRAFRPRQSARNISMRSRISLLCFTTRPARLVDRLVGRPTNRSIAQIERDEFVETHRNAPDSARNRKLQCACMRVRRFRDSATPPQAPHCEKCPQSTSSVRRLRCEEIVTKCVLCMSTLTKRKIASIEFSK